MQTQERLKHSSSPLSEITIVLILAHDLVSYFSCMFVLTKTLFLTALVRHNWYKNCTYKTDTTWRVWTYVYRSGAMFTVKVKDISITSQSFPVSLFWFVSFLFCFVVRTPHVISTLPTDVQVRSTVSLTMGRLFWSKNETGKSHSSVSSPN